MKQTIILDSTRISTFLECPEKLNLSYIQNLTPDLEINEDIAAGTYGHKLLEIYYSAATKQVGIKAAEKFHLEESFPLSADRRSLVAERFKFYWMRYQAGDYTTLFKQDSRISIDPATQLPYDEVFRRPLVEQGFSYKLYEDSQYLFVLEGRIDWLATQNNINLWVDHKFQGRARDLYPKSIQFRNYSLATGLNMGVINYIRLHKAINDTTLVRQIVSFSPSEMTAWKLELIEIFKQVADAAKRGYKLNRNSCSGKFGYPCQFCQICEESNKELQQIIKRSKFVKREEWKPW